MEIKGRAFLITLWVWCLLTFISPSAFSQNAVSAARFYSRCYQLFTGKSVPLGDAMLTFLSNPARTVDDAIIGCMALLDKGSLDPSTGMISNPADTLSQSVLDAFNRQHANYFTNNGREEINVGNTPLNDAYQDPLEPALLQTKILFQNMDYDQLLLSPFTVEAQRYPSQDIPASALNGFISMMFQGPISMSAFAQIPWVCDADANGFIDPDKTGSNCLVLDSSVCTPSAGHPEDCYCSNLGPSDPRCLTPMNPIFMKDAGPLAGIKFIDPSHPKWNKKTIPMDAYVNASAGWRDNSTCASPSTSPRTGCPIYTHRNIGGNDYQDGSISAGITTGVLGMPSYLQFHWGRSSYELIRGGLITPRRLAAKAMDDLLCRKIPSLTSTSVLANVQPTSVLPFRQNTVCMTCHDTIDNFAWTFRNHVLLIGNGLGTTVAMGKFAQAVPPVSIPFPAQDTYSFYTSVPDGRLKFFGMDGTAYDIPVTGINQLSQAMAGTHDFWSCPVTRYVQFLTGYTVDVSSPALNVSVTLSDKQIALRNFVFEVAARFESSKKLRTVIHDILASPFFLEQFLGNGGRP